MQSLKRGWIIKRPSLHRFPISSYKRDCLRFEVYTAYVGSRLPASGVILSVPSAGVISRTAWRLQMGPIGCPEWWIDCVWNVMAHAQKPYFIFRRNERVHLNRHGRQFSPLLAAEVCASAVLTLDTPSSEVVKGIGYPLHSPLSPSLPLPCVTVCHHVSTGLYLTTNIRCGCRILGFYTVV